MSYYYNVLIQLAAQRAGTTVGDNGVPRINDPTTASLYSSEMRLMSNAFWCQTGGWSGLSGNGSAECARTAVATMATINLGVTITPNDTTRNEYGLSGVYINSNDYITYNSSAGTYNTNTGPTNGLNRYTCGSESGVCAAINNELREKRSVLVKTTVSGMHWVTVTGTMNGSPATSFNDLMGVDPWYNGANPNNPTTGVGVGSTNPDRAGVIQVSDVANQNLHTDYAIITFKI